MCIKCWTIINIHYILRYINKIKVNFHFINIIYIISAINIINANILNTTTHNYTQRRIKIKSHAIIIRHII
jgi:hypothetical protein